MLISKEYCYFILSENKHVCKTQIAVKTITRMVENCLLQIWCVWLWKYFIRQSMIQTSWSPQLANVWHTESFKTMKTWLRKQTYDQVIIRLEKLEEWWKVKFKQDDWCYKSVLPKALERQRIARKQWLYVKNGKWFIWSVLHNAISLSIWPW